MYLTMTMIFQARLLSTCSDGYVQPVLLLLLPLQPPSPNFSALATGTPVAASLLSHARLPALPMRGGGPLRGTQMEEISGICLPCAFFFLSVIVRALIYCFFPLLSFLFLQQFLLALPSHLASHRHRRMRPRENRSRSLQLLQVFPCRQGLSSCVGGPLG